MTAATIKKSAKGPRVNARTAEEQAFMKGKCLAAMLALESMTADGDESANLAVDYRLEGEPQDNYTEKYLRELVVQPNLLPGFSAGLSSIMAECMEALMGNAESVAQISYEACHVFTGIKDHPRYTEPSIEDQARAFGIEHLLPSNTAQQAKAQPEPAQVMAVPEPMASATAVADMDPYPSHLVNQAVAVFRAAAEDDDTSDTIYGLRNLAVFCEERIDEALRTKRASWFSDASAALASLQDLMSVLDPEKAGGALFYAAQSLLAMAKLKLDEQWTSLENAESEAAHA